MNDNNDASPNKTEKAERPDILTKVIIIIALLVLAQAAVLAWFWLAL